MNNAAQRSIVAGPSCEELFLALRLRHEGRRVTFTVTPAGITGRTLADNRELVPQNMTFSCQVNELGIEDGSGRNWIFKLYDNTGALGANYLEGYMNTTTRQGWMAPRKD